MTMFGHWVRDGAPEIDAADRGIGVRSRLGLVRRAPAGSATGERFSRALRQVSLRSTLDPTGFSLALALTAVALMVGVYLYVKTGVQPSLLYRDANAIANHPFYYGMLEYLTSTMMIGAGAICLFTFCASDKKRENVFLLIFGALTLLMGLDDLVMLHESGWFLDPRIKEKHFFIVYFIMLAGAFLAGWRQALGSPIFLLAVAFFLLAVAGVEDQLDLGWHLEDPLEVMAFSFWSAFAVRTSMRSATNRSAA